MIVGHLVPSMPLLRPAVQYMFDNIAVLSMLVPVQVVLAV